MKSHEKSIKPFGLRVRKLETENILIDEKNYKNLETHLFLFFFFFCGENGGYFFKSFYHFHPLHRHLNISWAITAKSLPLHIASGQTRTRNLWFLSASQIETHERLEKIEKYV